MDDDGDLDPAFAAFDLAAAADGGGLASVGSGFDDDDDSSRRGFDRGRIFGFDDDGYEDTRDGIVSGLVLTQRGLDLDDDASGDVLNDDEDDHGHGHGRDGMGEYDDDGGAASRMSLAFELASAAEPHARGSNLLRDLGLEDDEQDDDEAQYATATAANGGSTTRNGHGEGDDEARRRSSNPPSPPPHVLAAERADTFDEVQAEAACDEMTASLLDSIAAVETLLARLRATLDSSVGDRQPVVETLASSLVKALYSAAKNRATDARDVTEFERILNRNEPGWEAILADLEPLPLPHDDDDDDDDLVPSDSVPASLATEFGQLRALTETILSALASVSDVAQVQSALASEAGRKLRALRAQAVTARDELVALDHSEAFVRDFEERARRNGKREYAQEARDIMRRVESDLDDSSRRARSILEVR
ncbi:hypothetical protein JCM11491_005093 [Sporobolomyces phaffii]